jgi:preprotein translocase subunit SecA
VAKYQHPASEDIIAVGVEPHDVERRSEDILFVDAREWTAEMEADARSLMKDERILKKRIITHSSAEPRHFSDARAMSEISKHIASMNVGRNDQCPCASGKKYKRCHGRLL